MRRAGTLTIMMVLAFAWLFLRSRTSPAAETGVNLSGDVNLLSAKGTSPQKDLSKVVEWLVPSAPEQFVPGSSNGKYQMVQHDKRFDPELLVVPVGSTVTFPNHDPWFHNVFSLYRGKRFDLGLYQAGDSKAVRFDRPGPSYIFCNIHPQMAAVVLAVDSNYFAMSDKSGHVNFSDVPPGRYAMHVWYENADSDALLNLTREVTVGTDHSLPEVTIRVVPHDLRNHKNKYGQDYDSGTTPTKY